MVTRNVRRHRNPYYSQAVGRVSVSATAETGGNARTVTITARDAKNNALKSVTPLRVYLSDAATGAGVAAAAPSGGIAIGAKGAILAAVVAGKYLDVLTDANGQVELTVTEAAAKTFYVVVILPEGAIATPFALAFA